MLDYQLDGYDEKEGGATWRSCIGHQHESCQEGAVEHVGHPHALKEDVTSISITGSGVRITPGIVG
eukprot:3331114-Pyramimonas_sp.AAC.1